MARIRTVKPEFFRHELLQDLEASHPELHPMLVFAALWGHCDKKGVFEWRPKQLSLDILPFIWKGSIGEAMGKTLMLLREKGLVSLLLHGEKEYGYIPTFLEHQRIAGKESQDPSKFPQLAEMVGQPLGEASGKQWGSNGEASGTAGREGKGREQEGEKERITTLSACADVALEILLTDDTLHQITRADIDDWIKLFPKVDVIDTLSKIRNRCQKEPRRRKDDESIRPHIVGCLNMMNKRRDDFEAIWQRYPAKDGKKEAEKHFRATVQTEDDLTAIHRALDKYLELLTINPDRPPKNGSTWFNNWQDWIDYDVSSHKPKTNAYGKPEPQHHGAAYKMMEDLTNG